MDSEHVKRSEKLFKSPRQFFCHISWSLWKEISSKNSFLVVSEILRLFVHILTLDEKCSLSVKASVSRKIFKCNYLKTKNLFLDFFLQFRNLRKILNPWKKKMSFESYLFLKNIDCKMRGYLNGRKTAYENTYEQSTSSSVRKAA